MPAVVADNYSIASGADLWAGRDAPSGTALAVLAATLSAGDWAELTVSGLTTGMFDASSTNVLDYCTKGAFDPVARQVRFFGQGHYDDQRWVCFDEAANAFSILADPAWDDGGSGAPSFIGHGYHHNAIDPATGDDYYRMLNGVVKRYARSGPTWSDLAGPESGSAVAGAIEWLPSIGSAGGLVAHVGEQLSRWDKAAASWTSVSSGLTPAANHSIAHYSAPNDCVVLGGGNDKVKLWKVGPSGSPVALTDCPIAISVTTAVTACCPVSGDLLVIGGDASARVLDVGADSWATLSLTGAPSFGTVSSSSRIIAVPLALHGVVMFIFGAAAKAWLYKHAEA